MKYLVIEYDELEKGQIPQHKDIKLFNEKEVWAYCNEKIMLEPKAKFTVNKIECLLDLS